MLDTIILLLPESKFRITNPAMFSMNPNILKKILGYAKSENNPTAADRKSGIYKPRMTPYKRGSNLFLKIEFSAPKILWRNNVDELCDGDFETMIEQLRLRIAEMGVQIWTHDLKKAEVLAFHPSKNILITNNYSASLAVRELKKTEVSLLFDVDYKEFRNSGEILQFYAKCHALIFYDKVRDLPKPEARAIDKDQTLYQSSLFDNLFRKIEILRMEVRLCEKRKINEILNKLGYSKDPTLEDIFKQEVCQKILKFYWTEFFDNYKFIFNISNSPQRLLEILLAKSPKTTVRRAMEWIGLMTLIRDDEGFRGLRAIIGKYRPKTSWAHFKGKIERFKSDIYKQNLCAFIEDIETQLNKFEPIKLDQLSTCLVKKSKV